MPIRHVLAAFVLFPATVSTEARYPSAMPAELVAAVEAPVVAPKTAQLVFPGGSYDLTQNDLLALHRAVQGEVAPGAAPEDKRLDARRVAETLINRFAYLRGRGIRTRWTLAQFVRAYAQPINPRWLEELCQSHPERCTQSHIEKRREHRQRQRFDEFVYEAVAAALEGQKTTHPATVHFAMPGVVMDRSFIRLTPDRKRLNTYFATADSMSWPGYEIN